MKSSYKNVLFILTVLFSVEANAQTPPTYDWVQIIGGKEWDQANGVAVKANGDVYTVGQFDKTVNFDPTGPGDIRSSAGGLFDFFLTVRKNNGNYVSTTTIGGSEWEAGRVITFDRGGNLFIAGEFSNSTTSLPGYSLDFDPGTGTDIHTSKGWVDLFISKYDSNNNYVWTRTIGGGYVLPTAIDTDPLGNVYVVGYFLGTVDFNPFGGDPHTAPGYQGNGFITKINADGSYGWTRSMGDQWYDQIRGVSISKRGVYITGYISGPAGNVVPIPGWGGTVIGKGGHDVFLAKLDLNGNYQWVYVLGSALHDEGKDIIAKGDTVYVTGYFLQTVDFDPSAGVDSHASIGGTDVFISKYQPNGTYLQTVTIGGTSSEYDVGLKMAIDGNNDLIVSGRYSGTAYYVPTMTPLSLLPGTYNAFILKLNSQLGYLSAGSMGSPIGFGFIEDMTTEPTGKNIFLVGSFSSKVDFDPGIGSEIRDINGNVDGFTLKLKN